MQSNVGIGREMGVYVWFPSARGGRYGKKIRFRIVFLFFTSRFTRFFVMLVFLFFKLFEHYSQTNFPIRKDIALQS